MKSFFQTIGVGLKYFFGFGAAQKHFKRKIPLTEDVVGLKRSADGALVCSGCRLCERVCPANAISLTVARQKDGTFVLKRFETDAGLCVGCGLCVESCPLDGLVLLRNVPAAARDRNGLNAIVVARGGKV